MTIPVVWVIHHMFFSGLYAEGKCKKVQAEAISWNKLKKNSFLPVCYDNVTNW